MNRFNVPLNLICPLSTTSKHILREPRKLPCRKTACFECIKALVKGPKNEFQCSFCLKIHSLQALETNRMFEIQMDDDLANLASYESNRLELASSNTRELFATSQNALDGLFEFYKFEMEIRLEVLKADIDMKAEEVGRNIDLSLAKSWDDIKNCFQKDDFEWDGKDLQKSEDLLQRLRIIEKKLQQVKTYSRLPKKHMEPSKELLAGKLVDPCAHNAVNPLSLKLTRNIKLNLNAHDVCSYLSSTQLLVTDPSNNCIHIFRTNTAWTQFRLIRTLTSIGGIELVEPTSISVDMQRKCVYLCLRRISILAFDILLEKSLTEIMRPATMGDKICEVFFQNSSLFILDQASNMFRVKYNSVHNVQVVQPAVLEKINILMPVNVSNNRVKHAAVLEQEGGFQIALSTDCSKILVYYGNQLTDPVEIGVEDDMRINSMLFCENGTVLFVHLSKIGCDRLVCYTRTVDNQWTDTHQVTLEDEIVGSVKMSYVNGHLVLVSVGRNFLVF